MSAQTAAVNGGSADVTDIHKTSFIDVFSLCIIIVLYFYWL